MTKIPQTTILMLLTTFVFGQNEQIQEDIFREKVKLELIKNFKGCELFESDKGVSNVNGKTEFWSFCNLKNGNSFLRIESHLNGIFFQEMYFTKNGKLRYAKKTENRTPMNGFAEMQWSCEFYFDNGNLITNISLGHGKTEDDSWNPDSIIIMYHKRLLERKKLRKEL